MFRSQVQIQTILSVKDTVSLGKKSGKTMVLRNTRRLLRSSLMRTTANKVKHINERVTKRLKRNQEKFLEQEIGFDSFELENKEIQKWEANTLKNIQKVKKNHLLVFGNLSDYASVMKSKTMAKRERRNPSLSDSEIKLSEDISNSGFSQRCERKNSSNLKNEEWNKDFRAQPMRDPSREKDRSIDKLNISKETDNINKRYSNLDILQEKDQSFSTKGPIVVKTESHNPWESDEKSVTEKEIEDYQIIEAKIVKEEDQNKVEKKKLIKESLTNNILEPQREKEGIQKQKIVNGQEGEDLIGYPSDDKLSKKQKNDALIDLESVKSSLESEEFYVLPDADNDIQKEINIEDIQLEIQPVLVTIKQKSVEEKLPSGFPSLTDNQATTSPILKPNADLLDELLNTDQSDSIGNQDLGTQNNQEAKGSWSEDDKGDSPARSEPRVAEILASEGSSKGCLEGKQEGNPRVNSEDLVDLNTNEVKVEMKNPEKNKNNMEQPDFTSQEKPQKKLTLDELFNDDLTGETSQPAFRKKTRTEDDLPGGGVIKTKDEKANILTDGLMYHLMMELRMSLFPQRVNPAKLKLQTEKEIKAFEKRKAETSSEPNKKIADSEQAKDPGDFDFSNDKMAIKTDRNAVKDYVNTLFEK